MKEKGEACEQRTYRQVLNDMHMIGEHVLDDDDRKVLGDILEEVVLPSEISMDDPIDKEALELVEARINDSDVYSEVCYYLEKKYLIDYLGFFDQYPELREYLDQALKDEPWSFDDLLEWAFSYVIWDWVQAFIEVTRASCTA